MALKQIVVELIADTRQILSGLKKTAKQTDAVTRTFRRLAVTIAGVFGARAMFRFFDRTIESTNALIKTAKGVGFTVNEYQRLTYALSQVGVEAGSAKIAIGDFQKRLSKAVAGTSPQFAKAFKDAGLDIRALAGMGPAAAFEDAFIKLAGRIDDPRIAGLFGNVFEEQSGKDMLKAARQFDRYRKAREEYARRVPVLSQQESNAIEDVNDQITMMSAQWTGLKQKIVADAAPGIIAALERMDEAGALQKMADAIVQLIDGFTTLIGKVSELSDTLPKTGLARMLGGGTYEGGVSPQQTAEEMAQKYAMRAHTRPGLLAQPQSDATHNYHFNQNNNIVVKDGDQARATRKLMEKEKRIAVPFEQQIPRGF